ncbi:16S rRNA (uracil(1498)-N(3))-methyltransferase [Arthrobacter sp. 35W]|uniref:16S rRNA (uracil(1498)-N(3))-methyltransferase n=1 Tax=Arthrobacter sp. 35W TaxID=1132441 RepID=UPI000425BF99|nr:16S rRNA (uracil(1498)-N(3))-methyltransferase [Arthrobacter sp. 35W]
MTHPIFYAAHAELATLEAGAGYVLGGPEGRHATTVKRLSAGEAVDLADGAGLRLECTVAAAAPGELTVRVDAVVREDAPVSRLVLVQALAKGDRDELAIETSTELGVDAVIPWQAERSIVRWKADKAVKGVQKWSNVVSTAAKQARRAWIPGVDAIVQTSELPARIAAARLALILHEDAVDSLRDAVAASGLAAGGSEPAGDILMIVGPEGGISPREVELFTAAGARMARLGPHVLRSSTAGPAAVALLSELLGRWDVR